MMERGGEGEMMERGRREGGEGGRDDGEMMERGRSKG